MQCFLFNPGCGGEADAEKKILYYHPPETPLSEQVSSVGLCEAIAAFSATFSKEGCESLHTQKGRLLSLQAEPNYWIVLYVEHTPDKPATPKPSGGASPSAPGAATVDSEDFLPPNEEALQDCSLFALLRRIYGAIRLACGPLSEVEAAQGISGLREMLSELLPLLLRVYIPAGEEDGRRLDLLGAPTPTQRLSRCVHHGHWPPGSSPASSPGSSPGSPPGCKLC